jgi:tetratricopeptide (TPR) repeat protein
MAASAPDADKLTEAARLLLAQGQPAAGEARGREALAREPDHAGAMAVLGAAFFMQERFSEACDWYTRLTQMQPRIASHWINLGTAHRAAGRIEEALRAYTEAARLGEASANFHFNVGLAHLERRDYESARACLARAIELAPLDAEARYNYSKACYESLRPEEATAALENWQQLPGVHTELAANIGQLLTSLGEPERAEPALELALRDPSPQPHVLLTLAQVLERTNRLDEARALLRRLEAHPQANRTGIDLVVAQAILAQRDNRHELACTLFRQALETCHEFDKRHFHLFPLAKSLDALARYDEAFEVLVEAHRSYEAHLKLTAPLVVTRGPAPLFVSRLGCTPADIASWNTSDASPPASASPVFLVGFPRSGTTLLELALDAHPALQSMDEQPFVQAALADFVAAGCNYPHDIGRADEGTLEAIRAKYWARVARKVTLAPGRRLVDKNPMNMAALPAIARLFPQARILLAIRHPCDVIMSCFMQHFRAPDFALLCRDIPTLATGYRYAFDFWYEQAALLKPVFLEVRYETLIANFAAEMRRVVTFLDLDWDDAVLAPAERARTKRFVSTPSYAQVMAPINSASIGRSRGYARYLAPALPALRPYLRRFGYEAHSEMAQTDESKTK